MTPQCERFARIVSGGDERIDLGEAALVIASEEYPDLDVAAYVNRLDEMAVVLRNRLRADIGAADTIAALNRYLFDELGFSGNDTDYYDPRNSFLNDVLERRRGIPISLAVLYIEIGRRVGLPVCGVSFPAHFLVKCVLREGAVILDPYHGGVSLGLDDLRRRLRGLQPERNLSDAAIAAMLGTATAREILVRMLRNLKAIYLHHKDWRRALAAAERIVSALPDSAAEYRDRGMIYLSLECFRPALFDLQSYLKMAPGAPDAGAIRNTIMDVQQRAQQIN